MTNKRDQWIRPGNAAKRAVVASHRRSGTHLLLEYITRELGLVPGKSHAFAEKVPERLATIYIVRHPIETLWSTYRWFTEGNGRSRNKHIATALNGLSFQQYLAGEGGPRVGFAAMADDDTTDSLLDGRGMFYAPIRFWADHVRSFLESGRDVLLVRYEDLLDAPQEQIRRVAEHLGVEMAASFTAIARSELVGHDPSMPPQLPTEVHWSASSLALAHRDTGDLLKTLGYELPAPRRSPSAGAPHHAVRYVSRVDRSGISIAAKRCFQAMVAAGIDVVWEPEPKRPHSGRRQPPPTSHELLAAHYQPQGDTEFTVVHTAPEFWAPVRDYFPWGKFIGHTVWEMEHVPHVWRGHLHTADELWVPTEWNRGVFEIDHVRRPVRVIPHVITTDPVHPPPLDIPEDVTVFTTIATWHPRKRPDRAVQAFATAFTKDDPVVLIVKTPPWTDAWPADNDVERMTWFQLALVLRHFPNPPQVILANEEFTDAEVNGLLKRSDCLISLSSSEGWGLGQFDAATFAKPVITTAYGGHLEYFGPTYPGLVPFEWEPVGESENSPHLETTMQWASPDIAAAATMMREIVDGTSPILSAAARLAPKLRARYSPERVGRDILDLLAHTR